MASTTGRRLVSLRRAADTLCEHARNADRRPAPRHRLPAGAHAGGDARGHPRQRDHRRRLHRPQRRRLPDARRPPPRRPHRLHLLRPRLGRLRRRQAQRPAARPRASCACWSAQLEALASCAEADLAGAIADHQPPARAAARARGAGAARPATAPTRASQPPWLALSCGASGALRRLRARARPSRLERDAQRRRVEPAADRPVASARPRAG